MTTDPTPQPEFEQTIPPPSPPGWPQYQTAPPPPPQPERPAPTPANDGVPVFGRRAPNAQSAKRIPFVLTAYRGETPVEEKLTARADVDLSSVMSLGRSGQSLAVQIGTMRSLLMRTLVDDDGISVHTKPEQVVPDPDADDQDDADLIPTSDLADGAYGPSDVVFLTPEVLDRDSQVLVEEATFDTADDAADHMREHGSSLRRFAAVMDDDSLWLEQSALEEIIDYLMTQAADRPTQRSSAPSRSRRRKGR